MLPRISRLKKNLDIERVFKKGKKVREGFLVLAVSQNDLAETRFGFVVSQKVSKRAVQRNQLKRRLRESIRPRVSEIKKGLDIILLATPGLEKKDFWEIKKTVNLLLKKSKCLRE